MTLAWVMVMTPPGLRSRMTLGMVMTHVWVVHNNFKKYTERKKKHIYFGCYLYQKCIACVLVYMNLCLKCWIFTFAQIVIHFIANKSHVCCMLKVNVIEVAKVKSNPYSTIERTDLFKCPGFGQLSINWNLLNTNINMEHENYAKCKFWVCASTDATADAASSFCLYIDPGGEITENLIEY